MARIENEEEEDSIHCATRSWARFETPPLKRVCSLISYRLVSAMRHMVDQSLPELLAYGAKLCIELLLFRTYIQLYTHIYTYQYRYIQIYMYAVGSRCCWMATSFARGWRFGQRFLARSVLFGLLVCCLATRHRRRANNDNNNSGKINNNKSNTKSATAIELSSIHWSIRLAHAARYVWRILNCACAEPLWEWERDAAGVVLFYMHRPDPGPSTGPSPIPSPGIMRGIHIHYGPYTRHS